MLLGFWVGEGVFKPWVAIIAQAKEPSWNPALLKIGVPFMVINWVAIFACLYMFGTVVDSNGNPVEGTWDHFYFSAVTLTTLGYGTVVPGDLYTEVMATIEALIGFMGFAVLAGVVTSVALKDLNSNDIQVLPNKKLRHGQIFRCFATPNFPQSAALYVKLHG